MKGWTGNQKIVEGASIDSADVLRYAKEEGVELSDEQLEKVAGGGAWVCDYCPSCGDTGIMYNPALGVNWCGNCGHVW